MVSSFSKVASRCATWMGSAWAFAIAALLVIVWALSGPFFGFSDTWELVINTATTIVTFLMVFLIQNTQNRDARALHLKIDELILTMRRADNNLLNIENLSIEELDELAKKYTQAGQHARMRAEKAISKHRNHHHSSLETFDA